MPNVRDRIGKSRGLQAREAQLREAQRDAEPAQESEDTMRGALGVVDARRRLAAAQRALKRQQQFAAGQFPSGR